MAQNSIKLIQRLCKKFLLIYMDGMQHFAMIH